MDDLNAIEAYHFKRISEFGEDPNEFTFESQLADNQAKLSRHHAKIIAGTQESDRIARAEKQQAAVIRLEHDALLARQSVVSRFEDLRFAWSCFRATECIAKTFSPRISAHSSGHIEFRLASRIDPVVNAFVPYYTEKESSFQIDGSPVPIVWVNRGLLDFITTVNHAVWIAAVGDANPSTYREILDSLHFSTILHRLLGGPFPVGVVSFREAINLTLSEAQRKSTSANIFRPLRTNRDPIDPRYHAAVSIAENMTDCAMAFVVSHEYVHLISGDTGMTAAYPMEGGFSIVPKHDQEYNADCGAMLIVMSGMYGESRLKTAEPLNPELSCIGPILFLELLGLLSFCVGQIRAPSRVNSGLPDSESHPHPTRRAKCLLRWSIEMLQSKGVEEQRIRRMIGALFQINLALTLAMNLLQAERIFGDSARKELKMMSEGLGIDLSKIKLDI